MLRYGNLTFAIQYSKDYQGYRIIPYMIIGDDHFDTYSYGRLPELLNMSKNLLNRKLKKFNAYFINLGQTYANFAPFFKKEQDARKAIDYLESIYVSLILSGIYD